MATYNPPSFPRRPKHSNILSETKYLLQLNYYRYEINTGMYVMSPCEKLVYNMVFLSLLVLLFSAVYYYLPKTTIIGLQRLAYYFTGSHKLHVNSVVVAQGVLHSSGEAVASLAEQRAVLNASTVFSP
ncbi:hypothetical protein PRZ48_011514 [Zasmidium cellare]|uniref:Uncharacterized protein n=1 Tax=Zasmidium cellare TaxID=395010 RepID=A0ABR0E745_ZASCE|nr:hypothetical protein PRZ48_011514 [Zasmidium cellare]